MWPIPMIDFSWLSTVEHLWIRLKQLPILKSERKLKELARDRKSRALQRLPIDPYSRNDSELPVHCESRTDIPACILSLLYTEILLPNIQIERIETEEPCIPSFLTENI
jgi:hypothetical protein